MDINATLPFISAVIMIVFVIFVFRRFFSKSRRAWHLFLWGVGLTFYLLGSLMEAVHSAVGWNPLVFRLWYLFGAVLVAAWLGQGTVQLLVRGKLSDMTFPLYSGVTDVSVLLWPVRIILIAATALLFGPFWLIGRLVGLGLPKLKLATFMLVVLLIGSAYAAVRVFTATLNPVMIADDIASVDAAEGYDEQTVLAVAASSLRATAVDEDGQLSSRAAPLISALVAEANNTDANVVAPESVEVGQMPAVNATVEGQAVALSGSGETLNVSIDGQQAGTIDLEIGREMHGHAIVTDGVRVLTPFFNMYGLFTLVGGAIYSAYIFLRKRIMPNRVLGNVLIASGALMPGIGGLMSRFGMGGYLYLGELLGAILMFAGFVAATNRPESAKVRQTVEATGDK